MREKPAKPSRLIDLAVRLGLSTRAGSLAASYLIARWLTRPPRQKPQSTPAHLGLDWEPISCQTEDGLRLEGWLVTPPRPRATLLLFHGVNNSRASTLSRIEFLVPAGYRCIAIDHRAHGTSDGRMSSFGYHERLDVQAVVRLARQHWASQPLGVLGLSMGAAAICFAADAVRASAQAVILESLYHDIDTAFRNRLEAGHYPDYFQRLAGRVVRRCERQLKVRASWLAPADHIARLAPAPFLLFAGSEDRHATPDEAVRLHARRGGPGEFLLVPGAGHEDVCETGGALYRQSVLGFLDRCLFAAQEAAA